MSWRELPREQQLRIATANLQYGGVDPDGDTSRWQRSVEGLRRLSPDIVLVQEMSTPRRQDLAARLWRTANFLEMTPVIGPQAPGVAPVSHQAILVATGAGLRIEDAGPPVAGAPWCQAAVTVPGMTVPLGVYSVHLSARSGVEQLVQAQRLASVASQRGQEITVIGGDFNNLAPGCTHDEPFMARLPLHTRPARVRALINPAGGLPWKLEPDYTVHHELAAAGLVDIVARMDPASRDPRELCSTGAADRGRIDRFYADEETAKAAAGYVLDEADGASDHQRGMVVFDRCSLAQVEPGAYVP